MTTTNPETVPAAPIAHGLPDVKHAFDLTEDQRMIQEMVREFARTEVAPLAHEIDEDHRFPVDTWKKMV
jgi:hypothetical protein